MEEKILYLKIEEEKAKKLKEILSFLKQKNFLDKKNKIEKEKTTKETEETKENEKKEKEGNKKKVEEKTYILIPVKKTINTKNTLSELKKIVGKIILEEKNKIKKPKSVKEILKPILKEKIKYLKSSFDILGRIAIIEETKELKEYNKKIAEAIKKIYPEVKSVYVKAGIHEGEYRIQPYKLILGEEDSTTTYIENKTKLYLDIKKTYFTPRLANERLRIALQIKEEIKQKIKHKKIVEQKNKIKKERQDIKETIKEDILVLFSGIAPYPIIIEKKIKELNKELKESLEEEKFDILKHISIEGVELNPKAYEYAKKNLLLNKTKTIKLYNEDAKKFLKQKSIEKKFYDRILMPLPERSKNFLLDAVKIIKDKGIIHFYYFEKEEKIKEGLKKILEEELKPLLKEKKVSYEILAVHKVGQYAPRKYRVCADIKINKIKINKK